MSSDLSSFVEFKKRPQRPHDGEDDEKLQVLGVDLFVVIGNWNESLEKIQRLSDVHALQKLDAIVGQTAKYFS